MRVLFVSYSPLLGGAERILLDIAADFAGEAAITCPEGPLAAAAREAALEVVPVRERSLALRASVRDRGAAPWRLAGAARDLRALVARERPSVVVGWSMRGALVSAAALATLRRPPRLVFQHNDLLPGPAVGAAVRLAARRADRVVALSQAIAADLDPRGRLGVAVVHPGVELDRFDPSAAASTPPEVLTLAALVPWKRPDVALEAFALAAARRPDLRLTVAGAPIGSRSERLLARLRERAARPDLAGRVTFAGAVPDPRPLLARASCLLHSADREPFGLALVEALAGGRPVVAAAAAGPLEIVDDSCGRLFEPGDSSAAAAALLDVLERSGSMTAACRARAERFSLAEARRRWRAAAPA